jgi:microcystin-dependent protein
MVETQISGLATKLTNLSFASPITTISNTLASSTLTFSTSINTITTTVFDKVQYLSNITSDIKASLDVLTEKMSGFYRSAVGTYFFESNLVAVANFNGLLPAEVARLDNIQENIQDTIDLFRKQIPQVGTVIYSVSPNLATFTSQEYILCDGSAYPRYGKFNNLFIMIGTFFGAGNGSTTFNIPNYQGMFLRGLGSQYVPSVGVTYSGSSSAEIPQGDTVQEHKHLGQNGAYLGTQNQTQTLGWNVGGQKPNSYDFDTTGFQTSGSRTGFETRPASYSLYIYIKT